VTDTSSVLETLAILFAAGPDRSPFNEEIAMNRRRMLVVLGGLLGLSVTGVRAADQDQERERVYGWELMTDAERAEYRERMRNLHTNAEREAFGLEHHKKIQERASKRGVELPEMPMERGRGMGPGNGMGMGMGPGMGPGGGMGPRNGMGPRY
jgi:hypothetical protein